MCFRLHKLDFHTWKVEPSNSLTKRAALFCQIARPILHVDVFDFPQNRQSFTGMQSLSFHHSVLRIIIFSKSTQGCKKASKTRVRIQDGDEENSTV